MTPAMHGLGQSQPALPQHRPRGLNHEFFTVSDVSNLISNDPTILARSTMTLISR